MVSLSSDRPRITRSFEPSAQARAEAAVDQELVVRFKNGEVSVFEELMSRHRERVFARVRGLLRDYADVEEITQDTFIRAYRGLTGFRGDSSFSTWLYFIATNLARNRYWYVHRRKQGLMVSLDCPLSDVSSSTFTDIMPAPGTSPAHSTVLAEFSGIAEDCFGQLTAEHREVLVMRMVLFKSYEEIGQALGVNVGTVKSRIARARGELFSYLKLHYPDLASQRDMLRVLHA